MNLEKDVLTQNEAAQYIDDHPDYDRPMNPPLLSNLTSNGDGPDYTNKGNTKLFHVDDIDEWIVEKKEATADTDSPKQ